MSLDMLDASFMARRGVLRAQRTPYDAQFAVVLLLPRSDRPTQRRLGQRSVCLRGAPKNSPLMGPLYAFHNSHDKSRLDGCEQTTDAGARESKRYK